MNILWIVGGLLLLAFCVFMGAAAQWVFERRRERNHKYDGAKVSPSWANAFLGSLAGRGHVSVMSPAEETIPSPVRVEMICSACGKESKRTVPANGKFRPCHYCKKGTMVVKPENETSPTVEVADQ